MSSPSSALPLAGSRWATCRRVSGECLTRTSARSFHGRKHLEACTVVHRHDVPEGAANHVFVGQCAIGNEQQSSICFQYLECVANELLWHIEVGMLADVERWVRNDDVKTFVEHRGGNVTR